MSSSAPRYGQINVQMITEWMGRAPDADGPFWALNLMKYREVADYGTSDGPAISGREADDIYVPRDSLAAIGALITFGGDVIAQNDNAPRWDRIGIVRYPSRAGFFEMQRRDDFKKQHVHKDAGMDFTIVMACLPDSSRPPIEAASGTLVLRVARTSAGRDLVEVPGAHRVATFDVEGVIVGDERTWSRVAFDVAPNREVVEQLLRSVDGAEELIAFELGNVQVDRIVDSINTAPVIGTSR